MDRQLLGKAFGRVLRGYRLTLGLSQEDLAELADLDRTYPSLLERGLRSPSLEMLFRIAEALGIDPAELVAKTFQENVLVRKELMGLPHPHTKGVRSHESLRWTIYTGSRAQASTDFVLHLRTPDAMSAESADAKKLCGGAVMKDIERTVAPSGTQIVSAAKATTAQRAK